RRAGSAERGSRPGADARRRSPSQPGSPAIESVGTHRLPAASRCAVTRDGASVGILAGRPGPSVAPWMNEPDTGGRAAPGWTRSVFVAVELRSYAARRARLHWRFEVRPRRGAALVVMGERPRRTHMKIGILGSGDVAKSLARGFVECRDEVTLGTRSP